jgi:hypothetical protein
VYSFFETNLIAGMVEASAHLIGPVIMGTAYSIFVKTIPSMPFFIAAGALFFAFGLVLCIKADKPVQADVEPEITVAV